MMRLWGRQSSNRLMLLLMFFEVCGPLTGDTLHECAGMILGGLLAAHLMQHRHWFRVLTKGQYRPRRIFTTLITLLMAGLMALIWFSGLSHSLLLSRAFGMGLDIIPPVVHSTAGYWLLCLAAVHAGLHPGLWRGFFHRQPVKGPGITRVVISTTQWSLFAYGVYNMGALIAPKLFAQDTFADMGAGLLSIEYLLRYLTVVWGIAWLTNRVSQPRRSE